METPRQTQRQGLPLVSELREVLDDLDRKLEVYRKGLVADFGHRYQQTLGDVEPALAREVNQSLALSVDADYPGLAPDLKTWLIQQGASREQPLDFDADTASTRPELVNTSSSHPPLSDLDLDQDRHQLVSAGSPLSPSAAFGAALTPTGATLSSGDPHEREKEFQGLFTPFFLPLLDSSGHLNNQLRPLTSSLPTIATSPSRTQTDDAANGISNDLSIGVKKANVVTADRLQGQDMEGPSETGGIRRALSDLQPEAKLSSPSPPLTRPSHGRSATDDTISSTLSSALSDRSDSTTARRSALRRSSSVSKHNHQSPRRVRFEFKGVEILPTASPQPSDYLTPRPSSPDNADQPRSFDEIVGDNAAGEQEEPTKLAPPRKISSSEALRAMSRTPLDEGTVWTLVNSDSESRDDETIDQTPNLSTAGTMEAKTSPVDPPGTVAHDVSSPPDANATEEGFRVEPQSDDSSDEDFLSIGKSRSFEGKKPVKQMKASIPTSPSRRVAVPTPEPSARQEAPKLSEEERDDKDHTSSEDYEAEEEDDMFYFEGGRGLSAPPRPRRRPPPLQEDEPEPLSPERDNEPVRTPQVASPGVPIARSAGSGPATPTTSRFQVGSLGSYKGRPVVMPIVKNPELHAQAETLGEFDTFVGGVEEGELYSYRPSLVQSTFTGEPRSLSERMMVDDAREGAGQSP
ncbi:uncharacterized protein F5Z01DRAFT_57828 [Emericellopsis atlantica]|uniref:Uncharacterized protein n=1 Tax=Emericellopsis atlantica TaxID=2614577 RepID=A0A9P7ZMK1_9HYPO|nr:uncharacterized protein F5Z01DRAFT_57828 [Emericellopsis atlantica]KAG9254888.1 hypothetical protein F5Z01DRAFT_57828 [Emericellopsis atlantica]